MPVCAVTEDDLDGEEPSSRLKTQNIADAKSSKGNRWGRADPCSALRFVV
jgi:hypothetical protein